MRQPRRVASIVQWIRSRSMRCWVMRTMACVAGQGFEAERDGGGGDADDEQGRVRQGRPQRATPLRRCVGIDARATRSARRIETRTSAPGGSASRRAPDPAVAEATPASFATATVPVAASSGRPEPRGPHELPAVHRQEPPASASRSPLQSTHHEWKCTRIQR